LRSGFPYAEAARKFNSSYSLGYYDMKESYYGQKMPNHSASSTYQKSKHPLSNLLDYVRRLRGRMSYSDVPDMDKVEEVEGVTGCPVSFDVVSSVAGVDVKVDAEPVLQGAPEVEPLDSDTRSPGSTPEVPVDPDYDRIYFPEREPLLMMIKRKFNHHRNYFVRKRFKKRCETNLELLKGGIERNPGPNGEGPTVKRKPRRPYRKRNKVSTHNPALDLKPEYPGQACMARILSGAPQVLATAVTTGQIALDIPIIFTNVTNIATRFSNYQQARPIKVKFVLDFCSSINSGVIKAWFTSLAGAPTSITAQDANQAISINMSHVNKPVVLTYTPQDVSEWEWQTLNGGAAAIGYLKIFTNNALYASPIVVTQVAVLTAYYSMQFRGSL